MSRLTLKEIQKLIKDFEESNLTELELEYEEIKLKLSKNKEARIIEKPVINQVEEVNINENSGVRLDTTPLLPENTIKSPLVGTFYESSSPGTKPFVQLGDMVKKGDVVCIIEAMKIMNEITSDIDGIVQSINFKNGEVVGYDDPIITVSINATHSN